MFEITASRLWATWGRRSNVTSSESDVTCHVQVHVKIQRSDVTTRKWRSAMKFKSDVKMVIPCFGFKEELSQTRHHFSMKHHLSLVMTL